MWFWLSVKYAVWCPSTKVLVFLLKDTHWYLCPFLSLCVSDRGSLTASPVSSGREVQGTGRSCVEHPGKHTDAHRTGGERRGRGEGIEGCKSYHVTSRSSFLFGDDWYSDFRSSESTEANLSVLRRAKAKEILSFVLFSPFMPYSYIWVEFLLSLWNLDCH